MLIHSLKVENQVAPDKEQISNHVVEHFQNHFLNHSSILQEFSLVEEVIPNLVNDQTNDVLTILYTMEETYNVVFNMEKDSASGPNGFGIYFYHTYCHIIKEDVYQANLPAFKDGWILPNYNSNPCVNP